MKRVTLSHKKVLIFYQYIDFLTSSKKKSSSQIKCDEKINMSHQSHFCEINQALKNA